VPDSHAPPDNLRLVPGERPRATFAGGSVVQLLAGSPGDPDASVLELVPATVVVTDQRVVAVEADLEWSWQLEDLEAVHHGSGNWTLLAVPGVDDHGVSVPGDDVDAFRSALAAASSDAGSDVAPSGPSPSPVIDLTEGPIDEPPPSKAEPEVEVETGSGNGHGPVAGLAAVAAAGAGAHFVTRDDLDGNPEPEPGGNGATGIADLPAPPDEATLDTTLVPAVVGAPEAPGDDASRPAHRGLRARLRRQKTNADGSLRHAVEALPLTGLEAKDISAWFGTHHVLDRISLDMPPGLVTALIGPSGCGKSTFLRILNRMHEMIPSASLSGEVLLDGADVYDVNRKLTDARRQIGMVFQKPNPFPAMSIYDNVVASFQLTGLKVGQDEKDEAVETCLAKAGLWTEVRDRLRQPGGGLSGGQQQRLCIARALAIKPRVLLMDEPCSALDPTSTRRIEQTIQELASEVTIVIVTHNMQQAARVSHQCAFFLAEQGTPGVIVEHGPTEVMFDSPQDPRTFDYVNGRFG
jgi:phosphate transport system ATP-binding protein